MKSYTVVLQEGHSGGWCGGSGGRRCWPEGYEESRGRRVHLVLQGGIRMNQSWGQQRCKKDASITLEFKIHMIETNFTHV